MIHSSCNLLQHFSHPNGVAHISIFHFLQLFRPMFGNNKDSFKKVSYEYCRSRDPMCLGLSCCKVLALKIQSWSKKVSGFCVKALFLFSPKSN